MELTDLEVLYEVPGYIDETEIDEIEYLLPGQSAVVTIYPKFSTSIVEKTSTSKERGKVTVNYESDGKSEDWDKTFSFEMRGRNDLIYSSLPSEEIVGYNDMFDNMALIPCFITPEDPIMKYYTQQVQQKVLKGEAASVYQTDEEAVRFLAGVYDATLMAGMVYSGTKGIPVDIGDVSSLIQHIRLPREVVTGNTGLCIELSTLYCSVLSCAGLDPIVFMVPGHAYPGIRINGNYYAIEATMIGGEGLGGSSNSQEALEQGMKQLQEFAQAAGNGDPRYMIIDVHQLYGEGIRPMELKDDQFLREKIDEIAQHFDGTVKRKKSKGNQQSSGSGTAPPPDKGMNMTAYSGNVAFNYPANWLRYNYPAPDFPVLISQLESPDQSMAISVYDLQAVYGPDAAMAYLQEAYSYAGVLVTYQAAGTKGNYRVYDGQSNMGGEIFNWKAYFKQVSGGTSGITIGAPSYYYNQNQNIMNQIISTIR